MYSNKQIKILYFEGLANFLVPHYDLNLETTHNFVLLFQMVTLFPTKPKDQVFGSFYSQQNENMPARNPRNGYVPHHLVNVIQG